MDVAEGDPAVGAESGPDVDLRCAAAYGLERLLQRQDEPDRPTRAQGQERDEWLVLGVLLAAERPAGVRGVNADPLQRQVQHTGHDPLEPVGMLDRAPDRDAVTVRRRQERVRFDRELGDHRERVRPLDDAEVRFRRSGLDVAPAVAVLAQDVGPRKPIIRAAGTDPGPAARPRPAPRRA